MGARQENRTSPSLKADFGPLPDCLERKEKPVLHQEILLRLPAGHGRHGAFLRRRAFHLPWTRVKNGKTALNGPERGEGKNGMVFLHAGEQLC